MITFGFVTLKPDGSGAARLNVRRVPNPYLCFQDTNSFPSAKCLNLSSICCKATTAVSVISGIVTIGLVEASSLSVEAKTTFSILAGLLVLGSYYCYRLGSKYAEGREARRTIDSLTGSSLPGNSPAPPELSALNRFAASDELDEAERLDRLDGLDEV